MIRTNGSHSSFESLFVAMAERARLKPKLEARPVARRTFQKLINYLEAHRGKWFSAAALVKALGVDSRAASTFVAAHPELCEKRYFLRGEGMNRRRFVEVRSK